MTQRGRKSGFTLVEMLVVISIIAVLAAILFPVFKTARNKATMTQCNTKLVQLITQLKAYRADHGRYPPQPIYSAAATMYIGGFSALYPDYIDSWDALVCPSDRRIDHMESDAKDRRYSSYNGDVTDPATSWAFANITYNGNGYDTDGWALASPETTTLPTWLSSEGRGWKHYPRLWNRHAPDYTIVTHCIMHRDFYNKDQDKMDIIVRLNGDTQTINVAAYSAVSGGTSPFQSQAN